MNTGYLVNGIERLYVAGKQVCAQAVLTIEGTFIIVHQSFLLWLKKLRRINWSGTALSTFYAAIRKALVVVIVARALSILFGFAFAAWWIFGQ